MQLLSESRDQVCLVLCGTADSENDLARTSADAGGVPTEYAHVSVARELAPVEWTLLEFIRLVFLNFWWL